MRSFLAGLVLVSLSAFAQTPQERAFALRNAIKAGKVDKAAVARRVKLPVSRGFEQGVTSLCWVYAFLNAVETIERTKTPANEVEFSRAGLQYRTMQDRVLRAFRMNQVYLKEGGTPLDALELAKKYGLVSYGDFRDRVNAYMPTFYQIALQNMRQASSEESQDNALLTELEKWFGVIPLQTHWKGSFVAAVDVANEVFAGQEWISYAPGTQEAFAQHADPDARAGTQSFYTSAAHIKKHIDDALAASHPVTYTANGHVVLIYGADYDAQGKVLRFYIKDSYEPFLYTAAPAKLYQELVEVTMLRP